MRCVLNLITCLVAMATSAIGQGQFMLCDSQQGDKTSGPALPDLPDQFEMRIEANILQKNYSTEITEFYDYTNNRGAIVFRWHGFKSRSIMQFHNLERHTIYANNTCIVSNLTDHRFNIFNFTTDATGGHVKGVKDILMFGKQFGETYIGGGETVRGIPVDHWQSCLKFQGRNGSFTLDYFFSKPLYNMSYGSHPVPVRAVVNGTGEGRHGNGTLHSYYHVYDFFSFKPGPIQDENVFKIPVGVFCNGSVNQKDIPKLPDQFTTGVEQTHVSNFRTDKTTEQFYFDFPSKLLRNDNARPLTREDFLIYGNKPLSFIYDFKSSLVYIIDKWNGNCTVRSVNATLDTRDVDVHMVMRRAEGLFNFMNTNYTYQGKKTWRDIPVESWAAYNKSDGHFQEVFFLDSAAVTEFLPEGQRHPSPSTGQASNPRVPPGGSNVPVVPINARGENITNTSPPTHPQVIVGLYDRIVNKIENMTTTVNFFGFEPGHLDVSAFDVTQCYEDGHQYTYMSVKIKGSYIKYVNGNQRSFYAAARSALARGAGVVSTRVTSLQIGDDGTGNYITVFFILLDKIKVRGVDVPGPSLDDSKEMLKLAVAARLNFDVQYPTIEENFQIVEDSLWEMQPSVTSSSTIDSQKYGPGSMAGIGIGMLVVGAILGLLVAYGIYKKIDTSIPYKVTD